MTGVQTCALPICIVHSMVEYEDGAVIAQLGLPDMRLPIQYALFYPDRIYLKGERLDFFKLRELTFEEPDTDTFQGLRLAYRAAETGGTLPTVFNAANEMAVKLLLAGKIQFLEIPEIIESAMNEHKLVENPSLSEVLEAEKAAYEYIESRWF